MAIPFSHLFRVGSKVEPELRSPRIFEIGPAFRDIANTRGMTATARYHAAPHSVT
jgi:hypothetical protein